MAKKTGLGKGLDALFSTSVVEEEVKVGETVQNIKLSEIEPNRDQPRRIFDEEALGELADSIKRYGVIQPIIVTKKDDYYLYITFKYEKQISGNVDYFNKNYSSNTNDKIRETMVIIPVSRINILIVSFFCISSS